MDLIWASRFIYFLKGITFCYKSLHNAHGTSMEIFFSPLNSFQYGPSNRKTYFYEGVHASNYLVFK